MIDEDTAVDTYTFLYFLFSFLNQCFKCALSKGQVWIDNAVSQTVTAVYITGCIVELGRHQGQAETAIIL